jgi:hypothetical protein
MSNYLQIAIINFEYYFQIQYLYYHLLFNGIVPYKAPENIPRA